MGAFGCPGIEFFNQRVEAAYRKELVLGEDDQARADPPTLNELFGAIRRNYFRLYLNFMYFNIGRIVYLHAGSPRGHQLHQKETGERTGSTLGLVHTLRSA